MLAVAVAVELLLDACRGSFLLEFDCHIAGVGNGVTSKGNLMVRLTEDGGAQPVLLDWGWVVRLTPQELKVRVALSVRALLYLFTPLSLTTSTRFTQGWRGLVTSLADMDIPRASRSLKALGYENNQDARAPERSVDFFAYLMRDTGSRAHAQQESKAFFEGRKALKEADEAAGVREKVGRKIKRIPDSFIFVTRVLGLLRGLCATLEVELPLTDVMAFHAQLGAREDGGADNVIAD